MDLQALEAGLPGLRDRLALIDTPELSISSTDLQNRVRSGLPISYQLPPAVEEYVYHNQLYKGQVAQREGNPHRTGAVH